MQEDAQQNTPKRLVEAFVFSSPQPVNEDDIATALKLSVEEVTAHLAALGDEYRGRGIRLVRVAGKWEFRTADDLAGHLVIERAVRRKLSRASVETLAIVAYHQPVTRAEVDEIRGVSTSKGTFDILLEQNWIRPMGRRQTPGKPLTWGVSDAFLRDFGLASVHDLPGLQELKDAGLLDIPESMLKFSELEEGGDEANDNAAADDEDSKIAPLFV